MANVAHLPFPVPFLHELPARPNRHTQLVETQLSTIQVTYPPGSHPSWSQPSRSPVPAVPQADRQGCMFPSCLPLLFNAKVSAKDIFLLLLCFTILFCTVGWLPCPIPGQCPLAWPMYGSRPLGTQGELGRSVSSWVLLRKVAYVL